jgi:AraC family transcriptional regulator of arabinose operon
MELNLLLCGYSFHHQKFYTHEKNGLKSYLFRLQTEGKARALVSGEMHTIEAGDLLLYAPGEPYELVIDDEDPNAKYPISSGDYFLMCRGTWVDAWWKKTARTSLTRITLDDRILSVWRQLSLEKRRIGLEDQELIGYLVRTLCLYIDRACLESQSNRENNYVALQMKRYIEEHVTLSFKIHDVARSVGLSISRAVHLFKHCFGKSMIQYALEIRLSIAKERMHYSMMNLEQIAEYCGFNSYPHFHRSFKHLYGMSPKSYRDQASKLSLIPFK